MQKRRTPAQIAADRLRTGRPPKPPEERRSVPVMVYLTEAEHALLEELAKDEGVTVASLIMRPRREGEE